MKSSKLGAEVFNRTLSTAARTLSKNSAPSNELSASGFRRYQVRGASHQIRSAGIPVVSGLHVVPDYERIVTQAERRVLREVRQAVTRWELVNLGAA